MVINSKEKRIIGGILFLVLFSFGRQNQNHLEYIILKRQEGESLITLLIYIVLVLVTYWFIKPNKDKNRIQGEKQFPISAKSILIIVGVLWFASISFMSYRDTYFISQIKEERIISAEVKDKTITIDHGTHKYVTLLVDGVLIKVHTSKSIYSSIQVGDSVFMPLYFTKNGGICMRKQEDSIEKIE